MAESPSTEKHDGLEDSLSSDDWTIIDKKDSKNNDVSEEEEEQESPKKDKEPKETVVTDDACQSEESIKNEVIEKGEEADEECEEAGEEKDVESDDVSILSDESDAEVSMEVENKIVKLSWKIDDLKRQSATLKALPPTPQLEGNSTSNTLITCSLVALIFGILIAGQIVEFQKEKHNYANPGDIELKLRELSVIEEKLKELNNVKQAIDQLRLSIPNLKNSKDQLNYQKNENFKSKLSIENFEGLNLNLLNFPSFNDIHSYDSKLEMVEATYFNFCSIISRINATNSLTDSMMCKTPKILSELINFKKNLKQAFEQTLKTDSSDKRFFVDAERIIDSISESLLSDFTVMFSKFSIKIQERFDRLEKTINKRLCSLNNRGKNNDNFLNVLLNTEFLKNKCKDSLNAESYVDSLKPNATWKKEKNNENKKRQKYEDFKNNGYKYDYKNMNKKNSNYVKNNSQDIDESAEEDNSEEIFEKKSKGELKNDSWKKNKYDSRERNSREERKPSKNEKYTNYRKNNVASESNEDFYSFDERNDQDYNRNFEIKRERYYDQKFGSKKEYDSDKKYEKKQYNSENEYKKKNDRDYKLDQNKNYEDSDEFEFKKRVREFHDQDHRKKYDYNKKDFNSNEKLERNKKDYNENKYSQNSKEEQDYNNYENKRSHNYYDEDSKFNVYPENEFIKNNEEKPKPKKDKEYIIRPENFKESKYSKYESKDYKKDKYYNDGDWQMQRGKARENLRNSDWYFVRADLHKTEKNQKENSEETTQHSTPPLRPSPPPKQHQEHRRSQGDETEREPLRKKLFKKVRNSLFNSKLKLLQFKLPFW